MKFLLSLSLGPQQNNTFQHINTDKEVLAASVTSEIKTSETESLFSLLRSRTIILENRVII